jgi:hypothetical protein
MTNVPDADIYINGQRVGTGNVSHPVKRSKNVQVMAKKDGYQTAYYNIDKHVSATGVLDIIGTIFFLVPLIGVFTPGFYSLDQQNIALDLSPITGSTAVK